MLLSARVGRRCSVSVPGRSLSIVAGRHTIGMSSAAELRALLLGAVRGGRVARPAADHQQPVDLRARASCVRDLRAASVAGRHAAAGAQLGAAAPAPAADAHPVQLAEVAARRPAEPVADRRASCSRGRAPGARPRAPRCSCRAPGRRRAARPAAAAPLPPLGRRMARLHAWSRRSQRLAEAAAAQRHAPVEVRGARRARRRPAGSAATHSISGERVTLVAADADQLRARARAWRPAARSTAAWPSSVPR